MTLQALRNMTGETIVKAMYGTSPEEILAEVQHMQEGLSLLSALLRGLDSSEQEVGEVTKVICYPTGSPRTAKLYIIEGRVTEDLAIDRTIAAMVKKLEPETDICLTSHWMEGPLATEIRESCRFHVTHHSVLSLTAI